MPLYFAYGSNVSETRFSKRIKNYRVLSPTILEGYTVKFHKLSKDGSGKATLVKSEKDKVIGMLYDIDIDSFKQLDLIEGLGYGYNKITINNYITYIADLSHINENLMPYDWYLYLMVDGMISNDFPEEYIKTFWNTKCMQDIDKSRAYEHYGKLQNFNMYLELGSHLGKRIQTYFIKK